MVNALILAGAQDENNKLGVHTKAVADINGKAMIEYVIQALKECELVHEIAVVGPYSKLYDLLHKKVDYVIEDKASIVENLLEGSAHLGKDKDLLICTCDIPMVTSAMISDFIKKAESMHVDFVYPIVSRNVNEERYPEVIRTYTKLRDGVFTGGNLFFLRPFVAEKCCVKAKELLEHRKDVFKMAKILGWKILFLLLIKRLSILDAEKRFSKIFAIKAKALISTFPEIANDVDKLSDLEFVRKELE